MRRRTSRRTARGGRRIREQAVGSHPVTRDEHPGHPQRVDRGTSCQATSGRGRGTLGHHEAMEVPLVHHRGLLDTGHARMVAQFPTQRIRIRVVARTEVPHGAVQLGSGGCQVGGRRVTRPVERLVHPQEEPRRCIGGPCRCPGADVQHRGVHDMAAAQCHVRSSDQFADRLGWESPEHDRSRVPRRAVRHHAAGSHLQDTLRLGQPHTQRDGLVEQGRHDALPTSVDVGHPAAQGTLQLNERCVRTELVVVGVVCGQPDEGGGQRPAGRVQAGRPEPLAHGCPRQAGGVGPGQPAQETGEACLARDGEQAGGGQGTNPCRHGAGGAAVAEPGPAQRRWSTPERNAEPCEQLVQFAVGVQGVGTHVQAEARIAHRGARATAGRGGSEQGNRGSCPARLDRRAQPGDAAADHEHLGPGLPPVRAALP